MKHHEVFDAKPHDHLELMRLYGTKDSSKNVGILAFHHASYSSEETANLLWERGGIMVRAGLHCAPYLHARLGTQNKGVVRVGIGFSTTEEDIDAFLAAARTLEER